MSSEKRGKEVICSRNIGWLGLTIVYYIRGSRTHHHYIATIVNWTACNMYSLGRDKR